MNFILKDLREIFRLFEYRVERKCKTFDTTTNCVGETFMNHLSKTMRRLRAHVSQAVRGFPGMSLDANYLCTFIHKGKQVFGPCNFVDVFGFLRSKTSGKCPGKGVCTQLISISLFLSLFLFFLSRRFLESLQSTAFGLHIGLCGCCCSTDTHGTPSMSIEHPERCRTDATSSGCTYSTAHNSSHASLSRRRGKFNFNPFNTLVFPHMDIIIIFNAISPLCAIAMVTQHSICPALRARNSVCVP